ncbi:hypothetical protein PGB90_006457 [Kerria lacca]
MNRMTKLKHGKGEVYFLGTAHNSLKSIVTVKEALRKIKPHVVAIDMCLSKLERYATTRRNTKFYDLNLIPRRLWEKAINEKLTLELIREALLYNQSSKKKQEQLPVVFSSVNVFNIEPKTFPSEEIGNEIRSIFKNQTWQVDFRDAKYLTCPQVEYKIMLAGKPIVETLDSIPNVLTEDEINIIEVYLKNFNKLFVKNSSRMSIVSIILSRNRKLKNILVKARNKYIAKSLANALNDNRNIKKPTKILVVVKNNNMNNILHYWHKIISEDNQ